jgi:hypothetical protein
MHNDAFRSKDAERSGVQNLTASLRPVSVLTEFINQQIKIL